MPISSSVKPLLKARHFWLSFLFLLAPLFFYAQTLTGLWVGTVHNDSASVRKDQLFEIALTEENGKVTGFSRNEFIVNDTLYVIVKKVKGTIKDNNCEVTDIEVISCNFLDKLDKGVTVTSTFYLDPITNKWRLDHWKTNVPRRKFYSVGGKMQMEPEKDLTSSKLIGHLEELKKADELVIYRERNESTPIVKVAKPERIESEYSEKVEILVKNDENSPVVKKPELPKPVQPVLPEAKAVVTTPPTIAEENATKSAATALPAKSTVVTPEAVATKNEKSVISGEKEPVLVENQPKKPENSPFSTPIPTPQASSSKPAVEKAIAKTNAPVSTPATVKESPQAATTIKPATQKPVSSETTTKTSPVVVSITNAPVNETLSTNPVSNKTVLANPVETNKPATRIIDPAALLVKKSVEDPIKKSTIIAGRKSEFSQEVYFRSDSLILTLYDNGEIDGDTVSVYLNGEVVMPSQGLKSSAIRKTIHMDDGLETFTLVMFAESLGKYPPNTGLLVIRDGNDVYNLRFSSDFQKSSGIVFRRKQQ